MLPHSLLPLTKSPQKAKLPTQREPSLTTLSPRKAKQKLKSNEIRGNEFTWTDHVNILPGNFAESQSNGTGTIQDILLFDQKLRDATPQPHEHHTKVNIHDWNMDPHADGSLSILTSNKRAFEVLTSDRGQRVIASLVKQWEADKYSDNGRSLWAVVETFFTKLPYVFVKEDEMNSKALLRYVSALATLKDVIVQALFCTNPSAAMAISATLMPTHNEKIPLYWYCHQLEREIQMLKNSTSDQSWEMVHSSDIGLLQQATAQALLTFWKLPKRERIAFLAQVFSNVTEIEADLVRVLLENNTFILQQVLEELGYQEKIAINKPKMSTVGAVVAMSLQVSNQARQLNKWRNRAKGESLEPIQVRHKGIQVNNTIEGEDVLGALEPLNVQLPNRIRRSVIPGDKGFQVVLMQDYQPFTRRDQTHLLAKDMWTVSTHTESLIHHLSLFIDSSREIKSVPPDVITLATLLLEWLHFERAKANSNAKDLTLEVFDNAHFKQCIVALMDLLKGQPESHVPDNIKWLAASLQGFVLRLQNQLPNSDSTSIPRAEASTATPADLRALLKHGFPSEIVNQILSISNEKQTKERESKIIILIEQLQQYLVDKFHRTFAKEANTPVGFGEVSSTQQQPITTSPVLKTLLDQMKCLLFDGSDGQLDEEQAASLMLEFLGSFEQRKNEKDSGGDLVKMLTIESLGNLFEKKVELQLLFGPLDKTTRSHIAKLQNFINKLLPENVSCTNLPKPTLSVTLKPNLIAELCTLVDEALAKKDVFGEKIAVTLETLKAIFQKTQEKTNGKSLEKTVQSMIEALSTLGDENLPDFISSFDDMITSLRVLLRSCEDPSKFRPAKTQSDSGSSSDDLVSVDTLVGNHHANSIPLSIIKLSKDLRIASDAAQIVSQAKLSISPTRKRSLNTDAQVLDPHDESQPRGRKGAGFNLFNLLLDNSRQKKQNVLGISANELSEMFIDNKTVLNVATVQKIIYQIYRERYECNLTEQDNPNTTAFIDFVYDWYLRKYGLRKLAMQHLSKLLLSLKKQKKKSKKALLFCRFLGLFPPLFDYSALNFALGLLNVWTNGTFTVSAAMTRVSLSAMNQILEDGYDRRFGPFCSTVLVKERLTRNACVSDPTSIEQDVALEIALDEFVKMKVNVESMLEDIYKAGDVNEDDAMGFDEFATVVRNLAPCVSDREIVKMFKEALLDSSFETITKNRFVNVIIDQGVLSSRVNKFKAPTGANSATFPEYEKEQFELLEETWRAHEAEIIKTIEQIPHKETSSSLLLRVRILNMIISKRIDSETAWLSHRMIIRDMERFKDLNESAISEIKKKEAFFKEAVTRITTSKFGLFGDNSKRPQGTTAISQTSPPPINSGVVQYVEQLGEHDEDEVDTDEANETDIARIEDSLRSEMLNLADAKCDTPIETQLNLFDDAVKKVRRLSMSRASKAITKLTSAMKKMGRNSGTLLTPAPAPTQKPEHSDSADDGDEDDDVSF
ncbi:hypothetical protein AeRB84_015698 [Aphanomyces euteiches]|nr:hypothetical protein AeRB84_015698 [Aphanomyces euteiches]